jgi:hypothetical protein
MIVGGVRILLIRLFQAMMADHGHLQALRDELKRRNARRHFRSRSSR